MNTRNQIAVSVFVVAGALATVAFTAQDGQEAAGQGGMEGHDHAAMTAASGELKPVSLDAEQARRIGVTYAMVERRALPMFLRTVGTVTYDETRLSTVNPKVEGWVERLHVDFTGAAVRAGEPLMDIYSPALVSAQEELILAARLLKDASGERSSANARELLASARRRLAYWDIPAEEIQRIEESGESTKTLTLRAPASGMVVEKNVVEGDRIMPGMTLYRVADLSRVWLEADVFEKDMASVQVGQGALVNFEAYPGRAFTGRVTYVYPTVSMQSRTVRVRVELPNADGDLKPGMYAGLNLTVPPTQPTLVVPRSAVIETGVRTLVFVQGEDGTLFPREVVTGRASLQLVEILRGVAEGERVVSSAAFLVDAESNLGTMTGGAETMPGMDMGSMPAMDHSNH
ncbi:MAG TPA: efflux RND transporter periplasmic adaptor subunit [Longimicrobiales bacterium]|nr:efflux RND transporter periplasmic adaptor subunit [Longimicrobiales bacterium]